MAARAGTECSPLDDAFGSTAGAGGHNACTRLDAACHHAGTELGAPAACSAAADGAQLSRAAGSHGRSARESVLDPLDGSGAGATQLPASARGRGFDASSAAGERSVFPIAADDGSW